MDGDNLHPTRGARVVLYSHDTMGLGHMRRNALVARTLRQSNLAAVSLIVAGAREASAFSLPPGVDCLALPALRKDSDGAYHARSLAIGLADIVSVRSRTIRAAVDAFEPDVLIVDNVPRGAKRELDETLTMLRGRGRTRCVLGMRDILDDPITVQREWSRADNIEAIRTFYDAIWVYGDRAVYDPTKEYAFPPDVAAKVAFTGYLDQRERLTSGDVEPARTAAGIPPSGRLMLCLMGGGQDGAQLAEAFAQAELPPGAHGLLVTGPLMPHAEAEILRRLVDGNPHMRVVTFLTEPTALLDRADRVVAMGGYNTVNELLSFEKNALIVPRVTPRREQLIRAERFSNLGLIDMLHPKDLSPRALTEWLARDLPPLRARSQVDFEGLRRLPELLAGLLARTRTENRARSADVVQAVGRRLAVASV
jgi:predicted glycosyltransferase